MRVSSVIEGGTAGQSKCHAAANNVDAANEPLMTGFPLGNADGHEVSDLTDAVRRQKPCHQHVGIRLIKLLVAEATRRGGDLETPALVVIEERSEYARRIEARKAKP